MTNSAHIRHACALAAQLPDQPEDIIGVMTQLQRLVDEFILSAKDHPKPSVVALRQAESR
jgi:hypothetical protein